MRVALFSACLLLTCAAPATAAGLCAKIPGSTKVRACAESEHGLVIADSTARAQELLDAAEAGAARFQRHFGRPASLFAVIETNDGQVDGVALDGLKSSGFKAVLPWLSPAGYRSQIEASVRRAVEAQTANLPAEARESVLQQALAQVTGKSPVEGHETGAIAHELGHIWYIENFWPGREGRGGHYGGPGPDWMDETAAVLMESDALAAGRVKQFAERYAKLRAGGMLAKAPDNALVDLPAFFASSHPGVARGEAMLKEIRKEGPGAAPKNGVLIRASSGPEAEKFAESAIHYYLQSTMAAEYLVARTGDLTVFARIGAAFARGETIEQWLANKEPKGKLPRDLKALQADWLDWLETRFPATPAKQAA